MKKIWIIIRILVVISVVALIGGIVAAVAYFKQEAVANKAKYNTVAQTGAPILEAIYNYRNATELYPETTEDLSRVSDIHVDKSLWSYQWRNHSAWLNYIGKEVPFNMGYSFAEQSPGWSSRRYPKMRIELPFVIPLRPERTQAEKYRLIVQEIERRIDRDGTKAIHYQGLISHRLNNGDVAGALADATRMHGRKLDPWWELQILVRLLHRLGQDNWAEREMRASAEQEKGFMPFFYLAWFYREAGRTEDALQALGKASASPFREMEGVHYAADYHFWLAATYAYQEQHPELVLAVCGVWDANGSLHGSKSPDSQAFRAAALLAQGNTAQALSSIDRAIEMKGDCAIWSGNLDELSSAIRRSDKEYRWTPGAYPELDGYELLIPYQ